MVLQPHVVVHEVHGPSQYDPYVSRKVLKALAVLRPTSSTTRLKPAGWATSTVSIALDSSAAALSRNTLTRFRRDLALVRQAVQAGRPSWWQVGL